jgi:para-aminobenzoate synthetase component 1
MDCNDLASFVCKKTDNSFQKLFLLSEESAAKILPVNRYFCLIPYVNPLKKEIQKFFYEVKEEKIEQCDGNLKEPAEILFKPRTSKAAYIDKVRQIRHHIQLGDIYEMNFCVEFFSEDLTIDPCSVFERLCRITKAPYATLIKLHDEFIISASPELFLKKNGSRLITKPIKGTARRGQGRAEDERLKDELQNSIKERTENVMAVDVARNDLSVIASRGSVNVNRLYNIETFETVHQMVSTVSCELKDNVDFDDMINATFPMASMTGAPKVSAMKFIDELEDFERKNYSGAMGFIEENGNFELSVNIRSIFYNQASQRLSIAVGGAITHLSDPQKEYDECLLKATALLKALNGKIMN